MSDHCVLLNPPCAVGFLRKGASFLAGRRLLRMGSLGLLLLGAVFQLGGCPPGLDSPCFVTPNRDLPVHAFPLDLAIKRAILVASIGCGASLLDSREVGNSGGTEH